MGKLYQLAAVERGRQKEMTASFVRKTESAEFKRLLARGADDRCDAGVLWCYTTGACKWSVNVTVERGQRRTGWQKN